ncbi:hypothetical protein GGR57DRAFT_517651 [Xylariaceae sp. FL1272]|nr:hypothetical protein GGR57DRAFT_517651 [Xylariaceae sp. FL1272]
MAFPGALARHNLAHQEHRLLNLRDVPDSTSEEEFETAVRERETCHGVIIYWYNARFSCDDYSIFLRSCSLEFETVEDRNFAVIEEDVNFAFNDGTTEIGEIIPGDARFSSFSRVSYPPGMKTPEYASSAASATASEDEDKSKVATQAWSGISEDGDESVVAPQDQSATTQGHEHEDRIAVLEAAVFRQQEHIRGLQAEVTALTGKNRSRHHPYHRK